MLDVVRAPDVSTGWLDATRYLVERGGEALNLVVGIEDPTAELQPVRNALDRFIEKLRESHEDPPPTVETAAATIFPAAFYQPHAPDAAGHLFELEQLTRRVTRAHPENSRGTYFERLVAYPNGDRTMNQLAAVIKKLRRAADLGYQNGNRYELAVFHPARDTNPIGFPCLSHVSLTLARGTLHATAVYRNQYFIARAYGNFLGLGSVLQFLAAESGFARGSLVCVASHAEVEAGTYGRARVAALLDTCSGLASEAHA